MRCLMTMEIGRLRERLGAVLPPWSVLVAAGVAAVALALASRATTAEAAGLGAAPAALGGNAVALVSRTADTTASHLPVRGPLGAPTGALTHQVARPVVEAVTTTVTRATANPAVARLADPTTRVVTGTLNAGDLPLDLLVSLPDPLSVSTGAQTEGRAAIVAPAPTIPRAAIVVAGGATPSLLSVGWSTPIAAPEAPMPLPTGPLPTGLSAVVGPVATGGAMGGIAAGFLIALTRAGIRPRPPTPIRQVELISRVERPG